MQASALFGAKYFEIYGEFARTRGVEPVRTFCGQREGSIFRDFVWKSFTYGPLHLHNYRTDKIPILLLTSGWFS